MSKQPFQQHNTLANFIETLIKDHALPTSFTRFVNTAYLPIAKKLSGIIQARSNTQPPLVLGIQGTQGSGKSTAAAFLQALMQQQYHITSVIISIDDLYLPKQDRERLAQTIHPLLATRGVPGTHDLALAETVFDALLAQQAVQVPRFDKAQDDRYPPSEWSTITQPVQLIIFEGWCVGLPPIDTDTLDQPINTLEAEQDAHACWRNFAVQQLNGPYQQLFARLDYLLVIQAPSFECVLNWRLLQEQKLRKKLLAQGEDVSTSKLMSEEQVSYFVAHYERLTRHALATLPAIADWLMVLDEQHELSSVRLNSAQPMNMLVSTDLDGTLLDHHDYTWQAANPALRALRAQHIPLIFNSSKTAAELKHIQQQMGMQQALVVENGSALYIPHAMLSDIAHNELAQHLDFERQGAYWVKIFGCARAAIVQKAHDLREQHGYRYSGFADYTVHDIANITGLDVHAATRAAEKLYSEPFVWQDTAPRLQAFTQQLQQMNIQILKGGRFYHLQGATDKAQPLLWLQDNAEWLFASQPFAKQASADMCDRQNTSLICLGDNHNDVAMLNAADIAVCVKSPVNDFPCVENTQVIYTQALGPKGWNTAMLSILTA